MDSFKSLGFPPSPPPPSSQIPLGPRQYLEDRVQAVVEMVKVGSGLDVGGADLADLELPPEDLHPEQCEDAQEEEEQDQQGDDGLHAVHQ